MKGPLWHLYLESKIWRKNICTIQGFASLREKNCNSVGKILQQFTILHMYFICLDIHIQGWF